MGTRGLERGATCESHTVPHLCSVPIGHTPGMQLVHLVSITGCICADGSEGKRIQSPGVSGVCCEPQGLGCSAGTLQGGWGGVEKVSSAQRGDGQQGTDVFLKALTLINFLVACKRVDTNSISSDAPTPTVLVFNDSSCILIWTSCLITGDGAWQQCPLQSVGFSPSAGLWVGPECSRPALRDFWPARV